MLPGLPVLREPELQPHRAQVPQGLRLPVRVLPVRAPQVPLLPVPRALPELRMQAVRVQPVLRLPELPGLSRPQRVLRELPQVLPVPQVPLRVSVLRVLVPV